MGLYKKEAVINRQRTNKRHARRRHWVNYIKIRYGCTDCGYNEHPAALHFDHVDRRLKVGNISEMYTSSLKKLFAEIRKCEVRCAVCHAVKTAEQQDHDTLHKKAGRPRREVRQDLLDELLRLYKKGITLRGISRELDVPFNFVREEVIKYEDERAIRRYEERRALND